MEEQLKIQSVTGADLEFDIAGAGGRSYAFIVDWYIRFLVATAWYLAAGLFFDGPGEWFGDGEVSPTTFFYVAALPSMIIYFLYHPILEIAMDGRTPGKRLAGVRIVTHEGQSPEVMSHLIRNAFRLVDSLPGVYMIGLVTTVLTKNSVRFGDLAAGTLLIYDPISEKEALKSVEMSFSESVGLREAEIGRDLVERWETLEPMSRQQLARKLLRKLYPDTELPMRDDELFARLQGLTKSA